MLSIGDNYNTQEIGDTGLCLACSNPVLCLC